MTEEALKRQIILYSISVFGLWALIGVAAHLIPIDNTPEVFWIFSGLMGALGVLFGMIYLSVSALDSLEKFMEIRAKRKKEKLKEKEYENREVERVKDEIRRKRTHRRIQRRVEDLQEREAARAEVDSVN